MGKKSIVYENNANVQNELIWKGTNSNYSKAYSDFNEVLNKHRETSAKINEIETYLTLANETYFKEIIPEIEKQNELTKKHVEMMCVIFLENIINLGKNQKEALRNLLLEKCSEGIEEDRDFYFPLLEKLETTAERNYRLGVKKKAEKELKQQFGVDVDIDELNKRNFANEEERQQHKEKFKEFFEKYHEQKAKNDDDFFNNSFNQRERKKTKAQIEKEQKLAETEKLLSTDINKLFKDLAKLIHPDREQNPELRDKKEALMKELSNARDNMNIAEILRIKLLVDELIPDNQTIISFNDSSIKRFTTIIKQKIKELEQTLSMRLYSHPLFEEFYSKNINSDAIKKHIKKEIKSTKQHTFELEDIVSELANNPKIIKYIIQDYIEEQNDSWFDFRI